MFDLEEEDGPWEPSQFSPFRVSAVRLPDGVKSVMIVDKASDEVYVLDPKTARRLVDDLFAAINEAKDE